MSDALVQPPESLVELVADGEDLQLQLLHGAKQLQRRPETLHLAGTGWGGGSICETGSFRNICNWHTYLLVCIDPGT